MSFSAILFIIYLQFPPVGSVSRVCVSFSGGRYAIAFDGQVIQVRQKSPTPVNSMSATTLGYVEGKDLFSGFIDDVSFIWMFQFALTE